MDNTLLWFKAIATLVGGTVTAALGGWDLMLRVLVLFIVLDYFTGLAVAGITGKLNSKVGFIGIAKKILLFIPVAMAYAIDNLMGEQILRNLAIWFYIANEGLSILENMGKAGVDLPPALKTALAQLHKKGEAGNAPKQ